MWVYKENKDKEGKREEQGFWVLGGKIQLKKIQRQGLELF